MAAFDNANIATLEGPAARAAAVVPDDATDLATPSRAIYVGAAGHIAVIMLSGDQVTFSNAPAGLVLPIRVSRVLATGTTAGSLISIS